MRNKICRVWFIYLIGLSRMKATTMLSVLVLILFSIFVSCYSNAIWNQIRELLILSVMSVIQKKHQKPSYMMLSTSHSPCKRTKVHKVLLFCAFVRKQTTILHIILYFKLLGVEMRGSQRKIRVFTSSIVAI